MKSIFDFKEIPIKEFDPFQLEYRQNPYPVYHYLRSESPVHWSPKGYWILTRYTDVVASLKDSQHFSRRLKLGEYDDEFQKELDFNPVLKMKSQWLLYKDPPEHTEMRSLVNAIFTPRMVEKLRPRIQQVVDNLLDHGACNDNFDIIADFSYPLTIFVIAELLGVPAEDHESFKRWVRDIVDAIDVTSTPETIQQGSKTIENFIVYLKDLVNLRRKFPKDDLVTSLVMEQNQAKRLNESEVMATIIMLVVAGTETTRNLIANGTLALLSHPEQLNKLRSDPNHIHTAVEELLRYDSPAQVIGRKVSKDIRIGGEMLLRNQDVKIVLGAANRDPDIFDNPDELNITRQHNPHVAFGRGAHFCVGAALGRAEGQIAINSLIQRFPNMGLATDKLEWKKNLNVRVLKTLLIRF